MLLWAQKFIGLQLNQYLKTLKSQRFESWWMTWHWLTIIYWEFIITAHSRCVGGTWAGGWWQMAPPPNHIQNILNLACLTFTLSWALRSSVNEMAVAAMACVDGIPYSASTRVSSLTTGGDGGRGSFKISFITCPIYITTCRETEKLDVCVWCIGCGVCWVWCVCVCFSATHSPHVDEPPAQKRVEVPVDAGQEGDVKDLMTQSRRSHKQEVEEPVPHLITRPGMLLNREMYLVE